MSDFDKWLSRFNIVNEHSDLEIVDFKIMDSYSLDDMRLCWESAQKKILYKGIFHILCKKIRFMMGGRHAY